MSGLDKKMLLLIKKRDNPMLRLKMVNKWLLLKDVFF